MYQNNITNLTAINPANISNLFKLANSLKSAVDYYEHENMFSYRTEFNGIKNLIEYICFTSKLITNSFSSECIKFDTNIMYNKFGSELIDYSCNISITLDSITADALNSLIICTEPDTQEKIRNSQRATLHS